MAQARKKLNAETITHTSRGKDIVTPYVIRDADDCSDALGAGGLPLEGDAHGNHPASIAREFTARALDKGKREYEVDVRYMPPGGSIPPPTGIHVRWDIGTAGHRILYDIFGGAIGTDHIVVDPGTPNEKWILDLDAGELGTEILFTTQDFEVVMPEVTTFPINDYKQYVTHCNADDPFNVLGATFDVGEAQYMGVVLEPYGENPTTYRPVHRFRSGKMWLPEGIAANVWNGSAWVGWGRNYVPMSHFAWPVYEQVAPGPQYPQGRRVNTIAIQQVYPLSPLQPIIMVPPPA